MNSRELDSFLPSSVQMAPWAPQRVVTGSTTVTSALEPGRTVIRQEMLLGLSCPLRFQHFPVRHVKGVQLQLLEAQRELLAELDFEGEG